MPRVMWIVMVIWLAFLVGMGHYDNASLIGSAKWIAGVVAGLSLGGMYFALKRKPRNAIFACSGILFLLTVAFYKGYPAYLPDKIVFAAASLGCLLVIIWQIVTERFIREKKSEVL